MKKTELQTLHELLRMIEQNAEVRDEDLELIDTKAYKENGVFPKRLYESKEGHKRALQILMEIGESLDEHGNQIHLDISEDDGEEEIRRQASRARKTLQSAATPGAQEEDNDDETDAGDSEVDWSKL